MARQLDLDQPAYNLKPLFKIIKYSSTADINEALNINDPSRTVTRTTPLRAALAEFRKAVKPKKMVKVGMHYQHYTTLIQAFDLLSDQRNTHMNSDYECQRKLDLIWRQVIGYLQRGLPAVDRFVFARAFHDTERTTSFLFNNGSYPDSSSDDLNLVGLGFDEAILGSQSPKGPYGVLDAAHNFKTHVEKKLQIGRNYGSSQSNKLISYLSIRG